MTQIPYLTRLTAPSHSPVGLLEAKLFLRIDHDDEDELVKNLVKTATQMAEEFLKRSLVTQKWQMDFDDYAQDVISMPRGPVQSVESVKVINETGIETTLSAANYRLISGREKLEFDAAPLGHIVRITYFAGYGNYDDVPEIIRHGILTHVLNMYENRGVYEMPHEVVTLYCAHRVVSL